MNAVLLDGPMQGKRNLPDEIIDRTQNGLPLDVKDSPPALVGSRVNNEQTKFYRYRWVGYSEGLNAYRHIPV